MGTHAFGSLISLSLSKTPIIWDDRKPAALPWLLTQPYTTEANWPDISAVIGFSPTARNNLVDDQLTLSYLILWLPSVPWLLRWVQRFWDCNWSSSIQHRRKQQRLKETSTRFFSTVERIRIALAKLTEFYDGTTNLNPFLSSGYLLTHPVS